MKKALLFASLSLVILLSACGPRPTPTPTVPPPTTAPTSLPASPTSSVASSTASAPSPEEGPCVDKASFVSDVTVPDYSHFEPRETFTKTWEVKNVGTCTWTADYKAVYSSGDSLGAPISIPMADTPPGATLQLSANMAAPGSDGKFEIFYQLTNARGDPMPIDAGDSIWALITVGNTLIYAPPHPSRASPLQAVHLRVSPRLAASPRQIRASSARPWYSSTPPAPPIRCRPSRSMTSSTGPRSPTARIWPARTSSATKAGTVRRQMHALRRQGM